MTDARLDRAVEITRSLAAHGALAEERRALLLELRADRALSMTALAQALGISRQQLYSLLGPIPEGEHRRGNGRAPREVVDRREHYEPPPPNLSTTTDGRRYNPAAARARLNQEGMTP